MTIFRTVTPLPDENLAGLVARAAGANIYPHAHNILSLAGLGTIRPETLPGKDVGTAHELARVLGTSAAALEPLYYPKLDARQIGFFGTAIRKSHIETRKRRLSPRSLKDKAYIKAIWNIRPLTFDPTTRETLIWQCPVCSKTLGFSITWSIEHCEHCVGPDTYGLPGSLVDLRDFPQPLLEVNDSEALDFVVGLIDPATNHKTARSMHEDLAGLSRGELFETALAIADAIVAEEQGIQVNSAKGRFVNDKVHPQALAKAGRCLLNWPKAFDDLCADQSARATSRTGEWGLDKEFGAIARLRHDPHLSEAVREAFARRLNVAMVNLRPHEAVPRKTTRALDHGAYIGVRQLLRVAPITSRTTTKLSQHPGMIKIRSSTDPMAPVLFDTQQVAKVVTHFLDLVGEVNVSTTLGLPPDAVRDLAEWGIIDVPTSPSRGVAVDVAGGGRHLSKQITDQLVEAVLHDVSFQKPPKGFIPFSDAMLMFPAGRRPWLPVLMAIFYNRVDAVLRHNMASKAKVKNLFGSISLRGIEQQRERILQEHKDAVVHDIGRVSAVAANLMLGIYNHHVFMAIAGEKLIDVDSSGAADYRSVLDFASRFIFANEAAVRSRVNPRAFGAWAEAHHLKPAYSFPVKGGLIYDRSAVEPWLEMKA